MSNAVRIKELNDKITALEKEKMCIRDSFMTKSKMPL